MKGEQYDKVGMTPEEETELGMQRYHRLVGFLVILVGTTAVAGLLLAGCTAIVFAYPWTLLAVPAVAIGFWLTATALRGGE